MAREEARAQLTRKAAPLRLCGWRQLRNLLTQGEGIFWRSDKSRIWLRSTARVAGALGVDRLHGRPVSLPLFILTAGMGAVRAHFYAAFHSARQGQPIARDTLERITAVPTRTQRFYERRAGVERYVNFAIGGRAAHEPRENQSWRRGTAAFTFIDYNGRQGPQSGHYIAWQLPNSYTGPHARLAKGARKHLNRILADLQPHGMAGNGRNPLESIPRRYFGDGRRAVQAGENERYWQAKPGLWYCVPATAHVNY